MSTPMLAIEWGPVAVWAGAIATFLAVLVAILTSLGTFGRLRDPRLDITFAPTEPWCRTVHRQDGDVLWVRVAVENVGRSTARGCIGRLDGLSTNGVDRSDVDPVRLRWAGVPRSMSFDPVDLRPGQREFLNVMFQTATPPRWTIDTFVAEDFEPGFSTDIDPNQHHEVHITLFADNTDTITRSLAMTGIELGGLRLTGMARTRSRSES